MTSRHRREWPNGSGSAMTMMAVVGRPRTTRGVSGPDDDRDLDRDCELVRSSHLVLASSQRVSLASRGERISYLMFVIDFAMKHSRNRRPSQRTFPWRRFSLTRLPDSLASVPRRCGATNPTQSKTPGAWRSVVWRIQTRFLPYAIRCSTSYPRPSMTKTRSETDLRPS